MAKADKNQKGNKHFFKDFKAELKKVIWPTPKQVVNNTMAVVAIVLMTALIVFILDFAFEALNTYGINHLKNVVNSNTSSNSVTNETTENTTVENTTNENTANENTTENTAQE